MTEMTEKTSSRAINTAIKAVSTNAAKYNQSVQDAIILIIAHAQSYNDCTGAARLLAAMPRSNRRSLVIAHFEQYSPINVRKDGETFKASLRKPDDKRYHPFDLDGVKANNWWERPEADKLPDVINLAAVRDDFDKFVERERNKAKKVHEEAMALPEGPARTNRLADAEEISNFVERIVKAVKMAAETVVTPSMTTGGEDNGVPAVKAA